MNDFFDDNSFRPEEGADAAEETAAESAPAAEAPAAGTEPETISETAAEAAAEELPDGAPADTEDECAPADAEDTAQEFYRPGQRASWSDASYIPARDAAAVPKCYAYGGPAPEKKQKKEKKRGGAKRAVGVIAACLACAVIGGAAGGYAVPKLASVLSPEQPAAVETAAAGDGTIINVAATPAPTPQVTRNLVTGNQEKTATDIYYNIAVNQTVAITTEITYTNVWGYTSSGAVKGSGFILSSDGYIMTNYHVIEDAVRGGYDIEVLLYDGTEYIASVVGYAQDNDVAVLKIDADGLDAVTIGDSDSLLVGESVYAVGNPLGELEFSMSSGMVSAVGREITTSEGGRRTAIRTFQIDAPINSGNSGGPVYNSRGEVVGIATAKYSSTGVEGLGFAIPINDAVKLAQDLISEGYVRGRAYMGINADTVTASAAQYYGLVEGAIVTNVAEGSSADKAGLRVSDIIVSMGEKEVKSYEDLVAAKKEFQAGDTAQLQVYRSGEYLTLEITFDEEVPQAASQSETGEEEEEPGTDGGFPSQRGRSGGSYDDYYDYFYDFFGGNPFG